jgi:hypothetical protein
MRQEAATKSAIDETDAKKQATRRYVHGGRRGGASSATVAELGNGEHIPSPSVISRSIRERRHEMAMDEEEIERFFHTYSIKRGDRHVLDRSVVVEKHNGSTLRLERGYTLWFYTPPRLVAVFRTPYIHSIHEFSAGAVSAPRFLLSSLLSAVDYVKRELGDYERIDLRYETIREVRVV